MRVLLAAKYVDGGRRPVGGVQSWTGTVAAELLRLGHEVDLWEPGRPEPAVADVGIVANWRHTATVARRCRRVLLVSHGIIDEEAPVDGVPVAFTSEGVKRHWGGKGPVIRQPIDLAYWTPVESRERRNGTVLRYSYRKGLDYLPAVAAELGLAFRHLSAVTHDQAREAMRGAACVLATGRAALEAMACGVPVVIVDHRSAYQGPLLSFSPQTQMLENYSGRGGVEATPEAVSEAIRQAMNRGSLREHVERHHDASMIVGSLLEMVQ